MNADKTSQILARARERNRIILVDGCCSACQGPADTTYHFCPDCGGTFLTEEQIEKGEINPPIEN
jgi:predicted amidophosphoribosyltransferase